MRSRTRRVNNSPRSSSAPSSRLPPRLVTTSSRPSRLSFTKSSASATKLLAPTPLLRTPPSKAPTRRRPSVVVVATSSKCLSSIEVHLSSRLAPYLIASDSTCFWLAITKKLPSKSKKKTSQTKCCAPFLLSHPPDSSLIALVPYCPSFSFYSSTPVNNK